MSTQRPPLTTFPGSTTLNQLLSQIFNLSDDLSGATARYALLEGATLQVDWWTSDPSLLSTIRIKFEANARWPSQLTYVDWTQPRPTISALTPSTVVNGSGDFTMTVDGTNFVSGAVVSFDAVDQPTTFVSATQLTADIPATAIATAKTVGVNVLNPDGNRSVDTSFVIS